MLHKRGNTHKHNNFRPITLLNHSLKVLTKILKNRLEKIIKCTLLSSQNGFRPRRSTRDNLLVLQTILNGTRNIPMAQPLQLTFIDFSKAFDSINQDLLWTSLEEHHVPPKLITLIRTIYKDAKVRIKENTRTGTYYSSPISIQRGVLQDDCLSSTLFIVFLDSILRRTATAPLKSLAFADDVAFIHDSTNSTSTTLQVLDTMSKHTGLSINLSKTTTMTLKRYKTPSITPEEPNQESWENTSEAA